MFGLGQQATKTTNTEVQRKNSLAHSAGDDVACATFMDLTENRPVASRSNSNLDPHRAGAVVSGSGTGRVRTAHEVDPTGDDNTRDRPLKRRKTDRVSPPTPLPVRPETPKPFVKLNVRGTIEAVFSSGGEAISTVVVAVD